MDKKKEQDLSIYSLWDTFNYEDTDSLKVRG